MIRAIVFDVDDTIYDQQQPFREAIKEVFPDVTENDMFDLYIRFRLHSDEQFPKVLANQWTLEAFRAYRIRESLLDLGYPLVCEKEGLLFQEVYEAELENIRMHSEVEKTLNFLKEKNIQMGIITNGPTDHQSKKVKQLNLENWVDRSHVLISQATGYQKPEKEIFELAEQQFNLRPEETLYVGDNFDNDVVGAKAANWHALWFNHREKTLKNDQAPIFDVEINSFNQIYSTIKEIFV